MGARKHEIAFFTANSFGLLAMCFVDLGDAYQYQTKAAEGDKLATQSYPSLASVAHSANWSSFKPSVLYLACQTLLGLLGQEATVEALCAERDALAAKHGFSVTTLPDAYLSTLVTKGRGELSAVCTVVGGILSQEILKAVQRNAAPVCNTLVYDALAADSKGLVERAGA
eukprot:NODE_3700_length_640_cov_156.917090_g2659_i0.p1 GENE.NODE_3700_length_640_cov_156.917090_g2659_i0~~NODE_3700_length_640_cov_156.917090_g2659_i0.p1  ORF type:complete len:178 (+),score=56.67 NODE_3700_length_640_cov_156.917090_g2659_i0:25-534(+)